MHAASSPTTPRRPARSAAG